jgi:hypothetical protein
MTPPPVPNRRPTRGEELTEAKDVYLKGAPGRFRSALTGALQGLAAGGPGGAITGAATGAISPRTVREVEFNQRVRPQIQERFAFEDQQRQAERQAEADALNTQYKQAQIGAVNRSNLPAPDSYSSAPGLGIFNRRTGAVTTPAPPEAPKKPAQALRPGPDGNYYDVNDPAQAETLRQLNAKMPRDRYGRFISRADERASRPRALAPRQPKKEAKFASITDVREYAQSKGISESQAAVQFKERGYTIVR